MKRNLDYHQFTSTLIQEYGVSEAYADAAFFTKSEHSTKTDPVKAAHDYARKVPTLSKVTGTTSEPVNTKQMKAALSVLSDLLEADEDEPVEVYGAGLQALVILKLSSDTTLQLQVDPEDQEVLSATIRCAGFGVSHTEPVPEQHLPKIAAMFGDEIEAQLLTLIHPN